MLWRSALRLLARKRVLAACFCFFLCVFLSQVVLAREVGVPSLRNADSVRQLMNPGNVRIGDTLNVDSTFFLQRDSVIPASSASRWSQFCDSLSLPWVAVSSMLLPGFGQIVNRDYWKIPLFYTTIGGFTMLGVRYAAKYRSLRYASPPDDPAQAFLRDDRLFSVRAYRNIAISAAVACYSLSVADALISHSPSRQSPFAAMIASALLPGLGQLYNQSYWKIPVIYTGAVFMASNIVRNNRLMQRFDTALVALLDDNPESIDEFGGKRAREDLEFFRDYYQRYRDLNVILLSLLYVMNVVDAYVDAHLFYWDISDDLALQAQPILCPQPMLLGGSALAMQFCLKF